MPFPDFDPALFTIPQFEVAGWAIGPLAIRWYALAYVAGILLGWRYGLMLVRNLRLWGPRGPIATPVQIDDLVLWITLGVIVGGRLGYVLFYMLPMAEGRAMVASDWLVIFRVWEGGMSFHGGLIGVALAIIGFSWANRIDILRLGDLVAPCAPIGLFFGRIANFINGELWGRETSMPWGVVFCNDRLREQGGGVCAAGEWPRHPSQLYEAALEGLVIFLVLRWATHRARWLRRRGALVGLFLLLYGVFRMLLEQVRHPDAGLDNLPFGLTMGLMLSLPMAVIGMFLLFLAMRQPVEDDAPPAEPPTAKAHEPA